MLNILTCRDRRWHELMDPEACLTSWRRTEPGLCPAVVQSPSRVFVTPQTAANQASLSLTISRSLLKFMSIELVMPSNYLILSSPSPPAFNLSQHQGLFK